MQWCPNCKVEYREGFEKCGDCGANLFQEVSQERKLESDDLDKEVFLISVAGSMQATILESKLRQFGIPVLKKHREAGAYMSIYMGNTIYGIDIYVPSKSLDKAKEIIESDEDNIDDEFIWNNTLKDTSDDMDYGLGNDLEKHSDKNRSLKEWLILTLFLIGLLWALFAFIK